MINQAHGSGVKTATMEFSTYSSAIKSFAETGSWEGEPVINGKKDGDFARAAQVISSAIPNTVGEAWTKKVRGFIFGQGIAKWMNGVITPCSEKTLMYFIEQHELGEVHADFFRRLWENFASPETNKTVEIWLEWGFSFGSKDIMPSKYTRRNTHDSMRSKNDDRRNGVTP